MVLLVITPLIRSALESLPQPTRDETSLPDPASSEAISHTQLITLSQKLCSPDSDDNTEKREDGLVTTYTLNSLLRGTKLYISPPPPRPAPSPEYLALKARLESEAQAREYQNYLNRPSASQSLHQPSPIFSPSNELDESQADKYDDPLTPSLVVNILVSVLFTGFATYWGLSKFRTPDFFTTMFSVSRPARDHEILYNYPGSVYSQPTRVFLSMLAGLVVGVAEVVLYAAYLSKMGRAKKKEKRKVEKKTVIGELGAGLANKAVDLEPVKVGNQEKEEIWGKGVNGGARRRVRERWKEQAVDE